MSKAILVMDMPDSCWRCKLQEWANCRIARRCNVDNGRPDWCPLKPLPEKTELTFVDHGQDQIAMGWNACIDAILKDGE